MLLGVEALEGFSLQQQLELFLQVAPYLMEADEVAPFQNGLEQLEQLLPSGSRSSSPAVRLVRAKLMEVLDPAKAQLAEVVRDLSSRSGLDQLAFARSERLVEIDSADPGSAVDLLASCVISAKLAESGRQQSNPHTNRIVETFVEKLSGHLSSGHDYLVFDDRIAALVDAALREGLFQSATGPAGRSAQAMTASALMGHLPTFPGAKVDEVLDIRAELSAPLTQFRSAMVSVSKTFTSEAWERGFEDEIRDAWVGTVHPALQSIEEAVRDNRWLLTIASGLAGATNASFPGLAIVGAGIVGHLGTAADLVGGGLSAGAPLLQALRDRRSAADSIRMRPFYFLYGIERALRYD
jgi:hypothetical protein